ncbi:MAG: VWA domain-containing protein [Acidobacteria bacterium]|nr:VWA domain-containing protein [Acidobacteriota bacterium]
MKKAIFRLSSVLLFVLLASLSTRAQQQDEILKIDTRLVVLDAQVLNKNSAQQIGGLAAADFQIFEDNVKQDVGYLTQDKLPLSIILLLDVSGSMSPLLKELQTQALSSLQRLKPEDEVAVMAFANEGILTQSFTKDRELVIKGIEKAISREVVRHAGGGTNINEGVFQAAREMAKLSNAQSRRVVIAITDNLSRVSRIIRSHSPKETNQELLESGTVVCGLIVQSMLAKSARAIGTATTAAAIAINPIGGLAGFAIRKAVTQDFNIKAYAELTGGEVLNADKADAAIGLGKLFDHLRSRYTIGYYPANQNFDGKFRKIKLKLTPDAAKRLGEDVIVRTRQGYLAKIPVEKPQPVLANSKHSSAAPAATSSPATAALTPSATNEQQIPEEPVRAIKPPKKPLPPEEQSANVTKFSFIVYGDTRGRRDGVELQYEHSLIVNSSVQAIKRLEPSEHPIRFVLQTGDGVANGRINRQWNVSYIELINRLTQDGGVPYFLAPGNHDLTSAATHDDPQRQIGLKNFYAANAELIPQNGSPRRMTDYPVFSFGYGNSFFIAFDSNIAGDEKQFEWVKAQLEGLDRNRYRNVFVYSHHPAFSSGPHGGAKVELQTGIIRQKYMPLFRKHHVRAFFNGHEHYFEHWVERYEDASGKHRLDHVLTGGGGAPLYVYAGDPDTRQYIKDNADQKVSLERIAKPPAEPGGGAYHYVLVTVDGEQLKLEVIGVDWGRDFQPYRSNKTTLSDQDK